MYIFICLWVVFSLLPLQMASAKLVIPATPQQENIERVNRYHVVYGFHQVASGEFQMHVKVRYRHTWGHLEHVKHFLFRLDRGTIVQRDPETLVLRLENREVVVGQHRWWYSPHWQAADDVRITCDHYQQFNTVVVENCRLMIEGLPAEHAFLRP